LRTYNLAVVVVPDQHEDGREAYQAYCPDIEEAVTWGDTREEALRRINELLPGLVRLRLEQGLPVPNAELESVVVSV
jgi:predicted RNase H-like HicB family nuclease